MRERVAGWYLLFYDSFIGELDSCFRKKEWRGECVVKEHASNHRERYTYHKDYNLSNYYLPAPRPEHIIHIITKKIMPILFPQESIAPINPPKASSYPNSNNPFAPLRPNS